MDTVLVTGGAGRIGRAVGECLLSEGWRVLLADCDAEAVKQAARKLGTPNRVAPVVLDVTDLDAVKSTVKDLVRQFGPIVALVNAAGGRTGAAMGPFTESDPSQWRSIIDLHLRSVIGCCYAILPSMVEAKRGAIISVAAVEGLRGDPVGALFSAAKAGVIVLTETLVRECQPHGIRVNTVLPGHPDALAKSGVNDDSGDVAGAVSFLLSPRSRQVTGSCLDVSGGWALH